MTNITPQPRGDERGFTVAAVLALIGSVVFLLVCGLVGLEVERANVPLDDQIRVGQSLNTNERAADLHEERKGV